MYLIILRHVLVYLYRNKIHLNVLIVYLQKKYFNVYNYFWDVLNNFQSITVRPSITESRVRC